MDVGLTFSDPDLNFTGTVTITAFASPPATRIDYYVDNVIKANKSADPFSWDWDTSIYPDGNHTVKAVATHKNGKTSQVSYSVTTMNTTPPPASDVTAPTVPGSFAESADEQTTVTVTWTASTDAVGVAGYNLYKNGVFVGSVGPSILSYIFTGLTCGTTYSVSVEAFDAAGNKSAKSTINVATETCPVPTTEDVYVSDIPWSYMVNGWGPAERNMSNYDLAAGDGSVIKLNGVQYPKGIGCHAFSEIRVDMGGNYKQFTSKVGLEDTSEAVAGANGDVQFEVWVDGVRKYLSPVMYAATTTQNVVVDVTGGQELRLIVNTVDGNNTGDHAAWADAKLLISSDVPPPPPPPPPSPTDPTKLRWAPPVVGSGGVSVVNFTLTNATRKSSTLYNGAGRDLVINQTEVLGGSVTELRGWRHVVWIGGEFVVPVADYTDGLIIPRAITGTFHLEGVKLKIDSQGDALTLRLGVPIVQVQNCNFSIHTTAGQHADCIQTQFTVTNSIRVDKCTFTTDYQGLLMSNEDGNQFGVTCNIGELRLSRTNFVKRDGVLPATWIFKAFPPRVGNNTGPPGPFYIDDVWIPNESPGTKVYPPSNFSSWAGGTQKFGCFVLTDGQGTYVRFSKPSDTVPTGTYTGQAAGDCKVYDWAGTADGKIRCGSHADFCPSTLPGVNYVSPGYV